MVRHLEHQSAQENERNKHYGTGEEGKSAQFHSAVNLQGNCGALMKLI
jgi:hypothetical protein